MQRPPSSGLSGPRPTPPLRWDFARALDEAEAAALEAADARKTADAQRPGTPSSTGEK